jgi:HD-like signal output (HDOD) protein/CheY-like chemotaxis protein
MTKIIFVDDEPRILEGLRRMLRGMRQEWEMTFLESSQAALQHLAQNPADVIVTDLRMPGMDGSELLDEVRRSYPNMVRIILSGHADQKAVMKSVKAAQQFLAKPSDSEAIKSAIKRAYSLRELMDNDSLAPVISSIESLPALPRSYHELMDELESEDSSLTRIGEIVAMDGGMSATILKMVNSAFFGLPREITSPSQAVIMLGLEVVKALVLSHHVFSTFDTSRLTGFDFEALWRHCRSTAGLARHLARQEGADKTVVDEALVAGVLHDVGKLVLASVATDQYQEVLRIVQAENRLVVKVERQVFGTTHAEVGAYLIGLWGLSDGVVEALAFHHRPGDGPGRGFSPLTAVHVANVFEHRLCVINPHYARPELDPVLVAAGGAKISDWLESCRNLDSIRNCHD